MDHMSGRVRRGDAATWRDFVEMRLNRWEGGLDHRKCNVATDGLLCIAFSFLKVNMRRK